METKIFKMQKLSNTIRVVIKGCRDGRYRIAAQQYMPDCPHEWEVQSDGWRDTQAQYSSTFEGAKQMFDRMVRGEQRWVESNRR